MPTRESPASLGIRRSRLLRSRLADQLGDRRREADLSLRELSRAVGVSLETLIRLERGDPRSMTIDLSARVAAVLGVELAASVFPIGSPLRDRAHIALLERFRRRLPHSAMWRTEVPVPITGDLRSADAIATIAHVEYLIEAETHLRDFQALERRIAGKARDLGVDRVTLLLADTRHHRTLLRTTAALHERFPVDMRAWFRAATEGHDPAGDAIVIL